MSLYGGPPQALMLALRDAFAVNRFLETGTHRGGTAAWAAQHFGHVITIEASGQLHAEAVAQHGHLENVRFVLGDTRSVLPAEVGRLGGPAVVWLDSLWCGGETHGEDAECPVLFEIEAVRASSHQHYLFVDDARCFEAPPPRPHKMDHWPTLTDVTSALTRGDRPLKVLVLDDTFIAVPAEAQELVWRYAQEATMRAWQQRKAAAAEERLTTLAARRLRARAGGLARRLRVARSA
jgi:hypothetical protein